MLGRTRSHGRRHGQAPRMQRGRMLLPFLSVRIRIGKLKRGRELAFERIPRRRSARRFVRADKVGVAVLPAQGAVPERAPFLRMHGIRAKEAKAFKRARIVRTRGAQRPELRADRDDGVDERLFLALLARELHSGQNPELAVNDLDHVCFSRFFFFSAGASADGSRWLVRLGGDLVAVAVAGAELRPPLVPGRGVFHPL